MSNKSASKKHNLKGIKGMQPKSPMYKKRNKAKARVRKAEKMKARTERRSK